MRKEGQASLEMLFGIGILLFILLIVSLLLVVRVDESNRLGRFQELQLECERLSNLADTVSSHGYYTQVDTQTFDYNMIVTTGERGIVLQQLRDGSLVETGCNLSAARIFDDSNSTLFTVNAFSTIRIKNPGAQKVVISVV